MNLRVKIDDFYPKMQPKELKNLRIGVELDIEDRVFLVDVSDVRLEFWGDAYIYLKNSLDRDAYNGIHRIEIEVETEENTFGRVFSGFLFVAECEYDLTKQICTTTITDDGYNSKIKVNRNIKVNLLSAFSKNKIPLSAIPTRTINLFNPSAGAFSPATVEVMPIVEVLDFLTKFMTDNELSFTSDFFEQIKLQDDINYGLILGKTLRTNAFDYDNYYISFSDLVTDLSRAFNLVTGVVNVDGSPVIEMNGADSFKDGSIATTLDNDKGIRQSFVEELLYNRVKIGSREAITDGSVGSLDWHPPFDFGEDSYYVEGIGNIDKELNLSFETLIVDSNVIEDIISNANKDYDKDWFLISYLESTASCQTQYSLFLNNATYYYNGELTNKEIVQRHDFSGGVVKSIGDGSEDIEVWQGTDEVGVNEYLLSQQRYYYIEQNPAGNYSGVNWSYTATTGGIRNIKLEMYIQLTNIGQPTFPQGQQLDLSDYTEVYMVTPRVELNGAWYNFPHSTWQLPMYQTQRHFILKDTNYLAILKNDYQVFLNPADVIEIHYALECVYVHNAVIDQATQNGEKQWKGWWQQSTQGLYTSYANPTAEWNVFSNTRWIVDNIAVLNNIASIGDIQNQYHVNKFSLEAPISQKDAIALIDNPKKALNLRNNKVGLNSKAWAYNVSLDLTKSEGKFELISNLQNL